MVQENKSTKGSASASSDGPPKLGGLKRMASSDTLSVLSPHKARKKTPGQTATDAVQKMLASGGAWTDVTLASDKLVSIAELEEMKDAVLNTADVQVFFRLWFAASMMLLLLPSSWWFPFARVPTT